MTVVAPRVAAEEDVSKLRKLHPVVFHLFSFRGALLRHLMTEKLYYHFSCTISFEFSFILGANCCHCLDVS